MPGVRCLAVATFARTLTIIDITSPFCTICGSIPKMDFTPLCMDTWSRQESEFIFIGDAGGLCHLHCVVSNQKQNSLEVCTSSHRHTFLQHASPLDVLGKAADLSRAILQSLAELDRTAASHGRPKAIDKYREELVWSQIVHSNWVSKVKYVNDLESVFSCALDGLVWLMDVERRHAFTPRSVSGPTCLD
jgi:hypothetical protein